MKDFKNRTAFTLAEVLITLGIIGIVAAMTIPTLIANYKKTQYITGLKKEYATVNQSLMQMSVDAGCPGDLSCFFDSSDGKTMGDKIAKYFKVVKNCDISVHNCWPDTTSYYIDGSSPHSGEDTVGYGTFYKFITADGASIEFQFPQLNCNYSNAGSLKKICMTNLYIDTNGLNKPNIYGRDIFEFYVITDNGPTLYPQRGIKDEFYWINVHSCDYGYKGGTNKLGYVCAARIMENSWQMDY